LGRAKVVECIANSCDTIRIDTVENSSARSIQIAGIRASGKRVIRDAEDTGSSKKRGAETKSPRCERILNSREGQRVLGEVGHS